MKPLLSSKVKRGNGSDPEKTLAEWESAQKQATMDGLQSFAARQRARMEAAQAVANEAAAKVRPIERKAVKS